MRQRIYFRYEKRIKDLSSLEKVYEYFATTERDGRKVMTAQDVVRALVPTYPPVGSTVERAGFLDGEGRSKSFDQDLLRVLLVFICIGTAGGPSLALTSTTCCIATPRQPVTTPCQP
jgi:hypothetical protein